METIKTAVLYDPYLDTLGGGERYTLTIAQILLDLGWQVDLAWNNQSTINDARSRFGLKLKGLTLSPEYYNLFVSKSPLPLRFQALKNLDLVFVVSDGSVPLLFGKKTLLHYQVPFTISNRPNFINQLKALNTKLIVNSNFTKSVIDRHFPLKKSFVLYPPVDTTSLKPGKKTKTILNVGRFISPSHNKRQDVLIKAFKQMVDNDLKGLDGDLRRLRNGELCTHHELAL